jgi:4'-phosphopantetheinyl transferase
LINVFWLEQSIDEVAPGDDWLSAGEKARLADLRFERRRADWRLGRWTAKRAVSLYLKEPCRLAEIEIRAADCGAPEVFVRGEPPGLAISLSHRSGIAANAVSAGAASLGCDLEAVEKRSDGFVADFFTEHERAVVMRLSGEARMGAVALIWSAKESALKALREGLRMDTLVLDVTAEPAADPTAWQPLHVRFGAETFHGWWRCHGDVVRTIVSAPPPKPPVAWSDYTDRADVSTFDRLSLVTRT